MTLLRSIVLACLAAGANAAGAPFEVTEERERCASHDALRQPLFGDTHVHSAWSFDAAGRTTRNTPRDAYRFARGEALPLRRDGSGAPVRLARPLDWAVVSDHAEALGEVRICTDPEHPAYDFDVCWLYRNIGPLSYLPFARRNVLTRRRYSFCGEEGALCLDAARSAWRDIGAAAEEAYDRSAECRFTSFPGYEWSAIIGEGINLHRNVIFRNAAVPELPLSWVETPSAYALWAGLERDCLEGVPGCQALTIPHNPNLSGDGLMFVSAKLETPSEVALPVTAEEARRRQRFEPLVEIMQKKGDSECRLVADTVDEACGFEKLSVDSFAGALRVGEGGADAPRTRNTMVREALKRGLREAERLGVNPLKYGIIASTDTHLGTPGLSMEYAPRGLDDAGEPPPPRALLEGVDDNLEHNPGGLAVVWAEENSRDAIFEALQRRETYGTSGTRPVVRFFGGWSYSEALCDEPALARSAYAEGVPMGGDLPARPEAARGPTLLVSALRDPGTPRRPGTPLQRIQIVKGWLEDGRARERVFDVAGGDNGARVDPSTCERHGSGAERLCSVWRDPDFDPEARAFYYARVLENPSCRWTQALCVAAGVVCGDAEGVRPGFEACCADDLPRQVQERAWTSPIWYTPEGPRDGAALR